MDFLQVIGSRQIRMYSFSAYMSSQCFPIIKINKFHQSTYQNSNQHMVSLSLALVNKSNEDEKKNMRQPLCKLNIMKEEQSIGIMEGAFFVPKTDLLAWVNNTLKLQVTHIEQLGTGAVYCQIIDVMYPGKVTMSRVNWRARNEWQFVANYKILQQAFAKCKIQKHIDIQKLSKGKYQDNLEFIQWLKRYFDLNNKTDLVAYDAVAARKQAEVDFSFIQFRNPLKLRQRDSKQSNGNLRNARSPYDHVKPKINNRSLTLDKHKKQSQFFIDKLNKIRDILKQGKKEGEKLIKIQELIESIEEDLVMNNKSEVEPGSKLQKSESKKAIGRRQKTKQKQ